MQRKKITFGIFIIIWFILSLVYLFDRISDDIVISFHISASFIVSSLLFVFLLYRTNVIKWILEYRKIFLILAGILGMVLASGVYNLFFDKLFSDNSVLHSSLTILALGLPTFFILWLFRTHDVQRQIDKTKENTNNSTLFECTRMLTEATQEGEDKQKRYLLAKIALEQLAYLKRDPDLDKEREERIDLITQKIDLDRIHLKGARLSGLNLSGARLVQADLNNAYLNGVKLTNAFLSGTNLNDADLSDADLRGADLRESIDNEKTKWKGAIYSTKTKFYKTRLDDSKASRDEAGMIYKPDEQE